MKNSRKISRIFTTAMAVISCAAVFSSCSKNDKVPVIGINQLDSTVPLTTAARAF